MTPALATTSAAAARVESALTQLPAWQPTASRRVLAQRARLIAALRQFFVERGVLEVSTPVLGRYTVTDPHVEAIEVPGYGYLQTSPEAALKRLLCAEFPSLYQLGPAFRADEQGRLHSPEFTLLEWYRLGFSVAALREEVAALVDLVLGPAPYQTLSYAALLSLAPAPAAVSLDPAAAEDLALLSAIESLGNARVFIVDYPAEQAAMAKFSATDPTLASRFELVINGIEIANGYDEADDAGELRARFEADREARRRLGLPDREPDPYLLAALEHGLPACAGVALGVDRLLMLALGEARIEAVQPLRLDPPL